MSVPRIRHVRASVVRGGGADYHDQGAGHWIDDHISTPMVAYPEYRQSRQSFGINVLGTLVVEIEADDGTTGFAVTTGGELGAVHRREASRAVPRGPTGHRHREDLGPDVPVDALLRPQGHRPEHHQRRRPRAVGPARQDAAGTGVPPPRRGRPRRAASSTPPAPGPTSPRRWGSSAGRCRCITAPPRARRGCASNIEKLRTMRERVGDDFWLMLDCWMSLDLDYATRLAHAGARVRPEMDRGGPAPRRLLGLRRTAAAGARRRCWSPPASTRPPAGASGMLLEMDCCDIIQPDVGWCGGITELLKISALADAHGKLVVPHGSCVYSYHFVDHAAQQPVRRVPDDASGPSEVVPMFSPLLLGEPVPVKAG